jgi:hypothetical protein
MLACSALLAGQSTNSVNNVATKYDANSPIISSANTNSFSFLAVAGITIFDSSFPNQSGLIGYSQADGGVFKFYRPIELGSASGFNANFLRINAVAPGVSPADVVNLAQMMATNSAGLFNGTNTFLVSTNNGIYSASSLGSILIGTYARLSGNQLTFRDGGSGSSSFFNFTNPTMTLWSPGNYVITLGADATYYPNFNITLTNLFDNTSCKIAESNNTLYVSGKVSLPGLPTSAAGLATGSLWNSNGVLRVAP